MKDVLKVTDLSVKLKQTSDSHTIISGISFCLKEKTILGLIGESGSGKSLTALTILNLLDDGVMSISGKVELVIGNETINLISGDSKTLNRVRGGEIGMVFQEPSTSINPNKKCGSQLVEVIKTHRPVSNIEAKSKAHRLMVDVGIKEPSRIMNSYPHQLSGGQLQRVIIAMAISGNPAILIADEPTTSLDVTTQKEILLLLKSLQRRLGMSCIFISHDPMVIAEITDEVMVMNHGQIIESGPTDQIIMTPREEYTRSLMESSKVSLNKTNSKTNDIHEQPACILKILNLTKIYQLNRISLFKGNIFINALNNISISINEGSLHGIVGESGSGKSTLAKCLVGLEVPKHGHIYYHGQDLFSDGEYSIGRKSIQMVFQDPYSSLDPRMKIGDSIFEVLKIHNTKNNKRELKLKVMSLLSQVELHKSLMERYPHQLSGGQRQRVAIARSLAVKPDILICDEAVSALDVPVQAQILKLLISLKDEYKLTIIFISHDLSVIRSICDRVTVLYKGKIEEEGSVNGIFENPKSAYTKKLISSIPGITY